MNPEQWLSLKWNGGSTMSDRWLNQSKIIHCLEHDINPGTFYNWVHRFRKQVCEFPAPAGKDRFQAVHQEVVKMEIIPDHP